MVEKIVVYGLISHRHNNPGRSVKLNGAEVKQGEGQFGRDSEKQHLA